MFGLLGFNASATARVISCVDFMEVTMGDVPCRVELELIINLM